MLVFNFATCFLIFFIYGCLGFLFTDGFVMVSVIWDVFFYKVFWDNSDILWWLLGILGIICWIIGVGFGKIDFPNLILLLIWGGIEMGIRLLWFMLFDMLVLFVECILLLQLESELKKMVCRNILSTLDCFFVICMGGTGLRIFFLFFVW